MLSNTENIDPRVARTRAAIETAFLEILSQKTLHALTVGDVTKRAKINRTTFYAHFFDKYALFSHVVRKTFLETLQEQINEAAGFTRENLLALVRAVCLYFVYLNRQCPPADRQLRPVAETEVQAVVYDCLVGWFEAEPPPLGIALTATYVSWAIFGAGLSWVGNRSLPEEEVEDTAVAVLALVVQTLGWETEADMR